MKKALLFILLALFLTVALEPTSAARIGKRKVSGQKTLTLKHLESLYFISQDLEENAALLLKPEKGCFCSCRDSEWICTDMSCDSYLKKCENPLPEEGEAAQAPSTFNWQR